jgi:hypothetical protein
MRAVNYISIPTDYSLQDREVMYVLQHNWSNDDVWFSSWTKRAYAEGSDMDIVAIFIVKPKPTAI